MLRLPIRVSVPVCLLAASFVSAPARACTITTYSDLASWQNASSVLQTVNFEGLAPSNSSTTYNSQTGVTSGGVEFIGYTSTGSSWIQVIDTNFNLYYNFGSNDALRQSMDRSSSNAPLPYIHIVLPVNVSSFGMDLFTVSPSALSYTITVGGTQYTVPTANRPTETFWGITSDTPVASFDLTVQGTTYNGATSALLDDFRYGTAGQSMTEAPEATTFLLIGSGLIGIAVLRKWSL
jgi:hypothetical protein